MKKDIPDAPLAAKLDSASELARRLCEPRPMAQAFNPALSAARIIGENRARDQGGWQGQSVAGSGGGLAT